MHTLYTPYVLSFKLRLKKTLYFFHSTIYILIYSEYLKQASLRYLSYSRMTYGKRSKIKTEYKNRLPLSIREINGDIWLFRMITSKRLSWGLSIYSRAVINRWIITFGISTYTTLPKHSIICLHRWISFYDFLRRLINHWSDF